MLPSAFAEELHPAPVGKSVVISNRPKSNPPGFWGSLAKIKQSWNELRNGGDLGAALPKHGPKNGRSLLSKVSKRFGKAIRQISKRAKTFKILRTRAPSNGPASPTPPCPPRKAVVVGGGPAGSTAAMYLARQGYSVEVYEGRREPRQTGSDAQRAYMIALTGRGMAALDELGVSLPKGPARHAGGQISVHGALGTLSMACKESSVCFTRAGLAQMLIDEARGKYPGQINFHFNSSCEGVDIANKTARFVVNDCSGSCTAVEERYDLLVGADGVNSLVRAALQATQPEMTVSVSDSGREYKSFHGLPAAGLAGADGKECSTLHLWPGGDPASMVSAHSAGGGTFSGTLSLRTGEFGELGDADDVERLLRARFSKLPPVWVALIADQAAATAQPNAVGRRVECSQLHGPGAVVLGDAAHAVSPVFGQGANSALESCMVLGRALEAVGGDPGAAPAAFNAMRLPDTCALGELDGKAHALFWRAGILDAAFLQVAVHLLLGGLLTLATRGRKPNLMQIGGPVPYRRLRRELSRDARLAASVTCFVPAIAAMTLAFPTLALG